MRLHSLGDNRQINTLTMCSDLCLWYEMVSNTLYSSSTQPLFSKIGQQQVQPRRSSKDC